MALTPDEVSRFISQGKYDLIMIGMGQRGMDIYKLISMLKTRERKHKVIAVTADKAKRSELLQRGVLEVLERPYHNKGFINDLNKLLKDRRNSKRYTLTGKAEECGLKCVLRDKENNTEYRGTILDVSIDGALLQVENDINGADEVEMDFVIAKKSQVIVRIEARVVRKVKEWNKEWQVGVFFDDRRDLQLLKKMAPYISLAGKTGGPVQAAE